MVVSEMSAAMIPRRVPVSATDTSGVYVLNFIERTLEQPAQNYIAEIFTEKYRGRCRRTETIDPPPRVIVVASNEQLHGYFEIDSSEVPSDEDRKSFPKVERVYIVKSAVPYSNPIQMASIGVRKSAETPIPEDKFEELNRLGGEKSIYFADGPSQEDEDGDPPPPQIPKKVWQSIQQRQGGKQFRSELIRAYGGCCAVTRFDAETALEAAHILPYAETGWNSLSNGLLLRADIHTLFDLGLLRIHPEKLEVVLSDSLKHSKYAELDGARIAFPSHSKHQPSKEALRQRWDLWGKIKGPS
jgi:HNH endonuclease